MKKTLLLLAAFAAATFSFAQTKGTHGETIDAHGIITAAPANATVKEFPRTGMSVFYHDEDGLAYKVDQSGTIKVAFCADGSVFFQDIVSRAAFGTWVVGTLSGNDITIKAWEQTLTINHLDDQSLVLEGKNDDGGKTKEYCDANGYQLSQYNDSGEGWDGMRDLDHNSENVQKNCHAYLDKLINDLGYTGVRYDMVKGYAAKYTGIYNSAANLQFSVGEYYDGNHDLVGNWIKGTGYESAAFDFPLKFVMNRAFGGENWSELNYKGLAGDPNYNQFAVTFVDNHDTYRDDYNKLGKNVLAANAFILALPGTPCIFLPHFNQYQAEIGKMIKARKAAGINNNSSILQQGLQGGGYVMKVQGTKGSVLIIVGYVDGVDTKGYTLVSTGTNYAYFVSEGGGDDPTPDPEKKDINVYVKAAKAPYVYAWSGTGTQLSAAWPGDQVTKTTTTSDGTKWYTTTYNA